MSRPKSASVLLALAAISALGSCAERNQGRPATDVGIYFPAAMTLDPRVPSDERSRFLYVANANSNLVYNAGSLVAVDLDKFFHAWMNCPEQCLFGTGLAQCQAWVDDRPAEKAHFQTLAQTLTEAGKKKAEVDAIVAEARAKEKQRRADEPCGPNFMVRDIGEDVDRRFAWEKKQDREEDDPVEYEVYTPCRHVAFRPQVVECEDRAILAQAPSGRTGGEPPAAPADKKHDRVKSGDKEPLSVRMGSFITSMAGWVSDPGENTKALLLLTVKADPSITWVELTGGLGEAFKAMEPEKATSLAFECGQDTQDYNDPGRCVRSGEFSHALRYPFDDGENYPRIGPEPSNILVSKEKPWAYVTFASTPEVVLIDLASPVAGEMDANRAEAATTGASSGTDTGTTTSTTTGTDTDTSTTSTGTSTGTSGDATTGVPYDLPPGRTKPMIIDARNIFILGQNAGGGGWGLSERPCTPGTSEVPGVTKVPPPADECVQLADDMECGEPNHAKCCGVPVDCARPLVYSSFRTALFFARLLPDFVRPQAGQTCTTSEPGGIRCDPQLFFSGFTPAGGFDSGKGGQLGDIGFSPDGRRLFAVQSQPGALLFIDTSVDERGEIRDEPAGLVELCNGPARMALFSDGANDYAAVTCPTPNELFIVDLSGFRVVANVATGQGPHPIVVDKVRRLLYVGNTLDKTISVIDIARDRQTRFAEIARVGLQEPYKQ